MAVLAKVKQTLIYICKELFRLDIETFTWNKVENKNIKSDLITLPPKSTGQQIVYKDGKLYIWGAGGIISTIISEMYVYDIEEQYWRTLDIKGKKENASLVYGFCTYENSLYVVNGFDRQKVLGYKAIKRLDLEILEWEKYDVGEDDIAFGGFGYVCDGSMVYLFAGFSIDLTFNNLWSLDLSAQKLKWNLLGKSTRVPTARSSHAMQVYDDKLFILGGRDKYGNM